MQPDVEKAHKVYKEMVSENKDGHEAVTKPRNVKQFHNVRAAQKEDLRLTRDTIYNTIEIAYEGRFVVLFYYWIFHIRSSKRIGQEVSIDDLL